jgi:uncharacterized repeat protein (TIGR04138 family)
MDRKPEKTLDQVAREIGTYDVEAYRFVFESLDHLLQKLGKRRHVSGAELCHAIRELAIERFGFLARTVLAEWGVRETGDFGAIVFNLIKYDLMSKTPEDRQSDFNDIYDFESVFDRAFRGAPGKDRTKKHPESR